VELEPVNRKLLQQLKPEAVEVDVVRAEVVEEREGTGIEESELDVPMLDCMRLKAMSNFL
jgi:hypothetical protein